MIPLEIYINITGDQVIACLGIVASAWMIVTLFKD